jgi:hypothetical protein
MIIYEVVVAGLFCITGTYGGPGGGCRGGSFNERETLEQVAFGQAVRLATTMFCIAAVGAATAGRVSLLELLPVGWLAPLPDRSLAGTSTLGSGSETQGSRR